MDETAAVWAVVLLAGSPSPTAEDVAAVASAAAAAAAAAAATIAVAAIAQATYTSSALAAAVLATAVADTETSGAGVGSGTLQAPLTLMLSGLQPARRYDVYVVARDFRPPQLTDGLISADAADAANAVTLLPEIGVIQGRPTRLLVVTPDAAASLMSLVPSVGVLDPPFSPNVASYRLLVPDPLSLGGSGGSGVVALGGTAAALGGMAATVTFAAVARDPRWVVTVNGLEVAAGADSAAFTAGSRALAVVVRVAAPLPPPAATATNPDPAAAATAAAALATAAATGIQQQTAAATYLVRVMRASSAAAALAASDASLASLHITLDTGRA